MTLATRPTCSRATVEHRHVDPVADRPDRIHQLEIERRRDDNRHGTTFDV
jgi:hypothetical protein